MQISNFIIPTHIYTFPAFDQKPLIVFAHSSSFVPRYYIDL